MSYRMRTSSHPEIDSSRGGIVLDAADGAEVIAAALQECGAVCVRNVLPRSVVIYASRAASLNTADLKRLLGREVNDLPLCFADRWIEGEEAPPALQGASLESFGDPISHSGMDRSWYEQGERNFKRWFWQNGSSFPNIVLKMVVDSILPAIYRRYFGESCISYYQHDTVRYQRPDISHLSYPFHQDGSYHSRDPRQHDSLTTWLPFLDCGVDAPALQLVPHRLDEILPLPEGKQMPYLFCDEEEVLQRFGARLWAPVMRAGDVLLFDGFTVHRSYITAGMVRERNNADLRVFPKSRPPDLGRNAFGWALDLDEIHRAPEAG